ncbi:ABC transporter ATP-binding protein/permease [Paenibacillus sp. FSL R10-2734]|uniref:ABC transporter ATP-binding protein/permease n=1 Tax=Paenibacillus sp. FSL R10-2734 TaxID=2954691 RepID=UPI0030D99791
MFEIKNVSKQYNGEFALNNISFKLGKGLNFIVGASGSGKTTLLKIISGMEQEFEGEAHYCDKNIKTLTPKEKSYFYNNTFGFIWQDFNLLEDLTVLENVLLPHYLKNNQNKQKADTILKDLKIIELAQQKVKNLSGGQKQRVAIARELMKNPKVIIADEPTSALDEKTAKMTMDILRSISKYKTVIIVTHDTQLIDNNSNILTLDKGEMVTSPQVVAPEAEGLKYYENHRLSIKNAFSIAKSNVTRKFGRFVVSALALMVAGILCLTTVSGAIENSSQGQFDKLIDAYGEGLKDISVVNSFVSAAGAGDTQDEQPNANVTQDTNGLYDKYVGDERSEFAVFLQAFNDIKVTVNGKEYPIQSSGNAPVINKLVAGKLTTGDNEVVVPESFVKALGISNEQAIGTAIDFNGSIYNWDTGEPVKKPVSKTVNIVGVADTTVYYESQGQMAEYSVDDSFIFDKAALDDMRGQAGITTNSMNFLIRAKTPTDMISIKNELNAGGIVPLGRFELVENIVNLNQQTTEQSGSASMLIGILSVVMIIAIFLITGLMRKREFAIYKVSGFNNAHLSLLNLTDRILETITAIVLMLVTSPLINLATKNLFDVNILTLKMLLTGLILIVVMAVVGYFTNMITFLKTNTLTALKTGDK